MVKKGFDYDLVILGGGSAGIVSGVMAGGLGLRVLLISKGPMGGECLNTGCVPSKALLHAAKVARTVRTAAQIGFRPMDVSREEAAGVMRYVRDTIDRVREADATEPLLRDYGVEIRHGDARFRDAHTLEIEGKNLRAENFVLATGSRPAVPDIPGLEEAGYRTNQTLFDLDAVPESLLVVGGGPVGVEMAQAFCLLGSRVTLVQRADRILPRDDRELSAELETLLRADGIDIRLNAQISEVHKEDGTRVARIAQAGAETEIRCAEILIAAGRRPNVEGLNLEAAGVCIERDGVKVDATFRTCAPNIYACGDILGRHQFSHMAEYEAKIVVRNIVFPGATKASFRLSPWATFTDPELAHAGLTEEEARAQGLAYEVYRQPFSQNDRALTDNEGKGLVKVLTQGISGKILGVHILGPRAGELIQEWIFAMEQGHAIRSVGDRIHVYPTLSMACQHAAQRWYERKAKEPLVEKALAAYVGVVRPRRTAIAAGLLGAGLLGAGFGLARKLTGNRKNGKTDRR